MKNHNINFRNVVFTYCDLSRSCLCVRVRVCAGVFVYVYTMAQTAKI